MLWYCLKYRKNEESKNPEVARIKTGRIILLSNCALCDSNKSKFIKQQEASGLLSSLGKKIHLSKIPLVGPLCFNSIKQVNTRYKLNVIVHQFLLAGDNIMPEMHLRQPWFAYSACGIFKKNKEGFYKS